MVGSKTLLHIISSLTTGGAEVQLLRLLTNLSSRGWRSTVICLEHYGEIGAQLREIPVPVHYFAIRGQTFHSLREMWRLRRLVHSLKPSLIQGWMYHGNLAALYTAPPGVPVLWNVRTGRSDSYKLSLNTAIAAKLGAWLSSRPHAIIYNSQYAVEQHERLGFDSSRTRYIPNGFDPYLYDSAREKRTETRARLGITPETPLIGLIARYHPKKDPLTFLNAAALVRELRPDARFLIAGRGVGPDNLELTARISALGLARSIVLLPNQTNAECILAALDVCVNSSYAHEGFSNVIGEAMLSGVLCAVTDVGSNSFLVQDPRFLAPRRDPQALSDAIMNVLNLSAGEREHLINSNRERMRDGFNIERIASLYESLYATTLGISPRKTFARAAAGRR